MEYSSPILYKRVDIPPEFCVMAEEGAYGGDIRMGDLEGKGRADFLVYRSVDDAHDGGGTKPCFLGAFTADGEVLWRVGEGGVQPSRPGPVAIYDIDGDGAEEIICFFLDLAVEADPDSMAMVQRKLSAFSSILRLRPIPIRWRMLLFRFGTERLAISSSRPVPLSCERVGNRGRTGYISAS